MYAEQVTPQLVVEVRDQERARIVRLAGELDFAASPRVEAIVRECEESGGSRLVIDLRELTFIDSAGLRLLLMANWRASAAGRKLSITQSHVSVKRMLALTGLDVELHVLDPAEAAAL
ncbi:MAG TPA: STAS domain-containing protein [Solirubrobacterales bacterium]|jgi:anti-anti-sigma factor